MVTNSSKKSIDSINTELRVATLSYTLTKGEQEGTEFNVEYTKTKKLARSHGGFAEYDIIGKNCRKHDAHAPDGNDYSQGHQS